MLSVHFKDINGKNYLLDNKKEVLLFSAKDTAVKFIRDAGESEEFIESLDFENEKTFKCSACNGEKIIRPLSEGLGFRLIIGLEGYSKPVCDKCHNK